MSVTIYRRDGNVAFVAEKATTLREAVEQAAKSGADLTYADLQGADLSHATLAHADLFRANLTGADLARANLALADLALADLQGANLDGADLALADLARANLQGANLTGAVGVYYATIGPVDGWVVALTLTTEGLRISAGCRYFSFPEAREHWSDPGRWSDGASPEHGARMLAAVDALMALTVDWPEKLPEVSR